MLLVPNRLSNNPTTARPVKPKPMTAPDSNAIRKDFCKEILAAAAVLTFPLVAIFIPMYPEATEVPAPIKKQIADHKPSGMPA